MGNTDTPNPQNEHTSITSVILEKWDYYASDYEPFSNENGTKYKEMS